MIQVDFLKNYEILVDPGKKDQISHAHTKYKQCSGTIHDLIIANAAGHQVIPGEYVWLKVDDGRNILRETRCWRSCNVVIAEFDKDVPYDLLEDVVEDDEFIRNNAYALTHSVSSYYKNNTLRYRAWFVLEYTGGTSHAPEDVKFKLDAWTFAKDKIIGRYNEDQDRYPVADRSGSRLTQGAYGLKGLKHLILGNSVSQELRKEWAQDFKEYLEKKKHQYYAPVDADSFDDIPPQILEQLKSLDFNSDGASRQYLPCMFGGNHDNDERDPKMVVFRGHNHYTFFCHKCEGKRTYKKKLSRNDVVRKIRSNEMAHLALFRPPSKIDPLKLQSEIIYAKIEDNRQELANFLESDCRVLGMASETGGGKTETAINYAKNTDICLVLPTHKLASDIEKRVSDSDYQIWKSRFHDYKKSDLDMDIFEDDLPPENIFSLMEKMCITPNLCNDYGAKGGEVIKTICNQCPVYMDCKDEGYLSQFDSFSKRQIQIITMKDVFTNPQHKGFASNILSDNERVAFIDEAKAHDFYNHTTVSHKNLSRLKNIWQDMELGEICDFFIENWFDDDKLYDILRMTSDDEYTKIMDQLSSVRCKIIKSDNINDPYSFRMFRLQIFGLFPGKNYIEQVAFMPKDDDAFEYLIENKEPVLYASETGLSTDLVLSIDQCVKLNLLTLENMSINLPTVCHSESNWFSELVRSVNHYGKLLRLEESNDKHMFFATPPDIYKKLKKFVAMSATLDEQHFRKVFSGYKHDFIRTKPTKFHEGARLFQLRTGTSPVGYWIENGEFSDHALLKIELIEHMIENEPERKYGIISSVNIVNLRKDVWADMEPYIEYTNFGNTEGLNEMFKEIETVIILGSFQLPPKTIKDRAMLLFGDEDELLSFDRYKDEFNNSFYNDQRVQSVQNQAIIGELIQDIGRGRLNLYPKRVLLFSSYFIPTYSERAFHFDMADLEIAQSFSSLEDVIIKRQKEELEMSDKEKSAIQMYREGKNTAEIQKSLDLSVYQLKKIRKKHNIVVENPIQKQIRILIAKQRECNISYIRQNTDLRDSKIQYHLNQMVKRGIVSKIGYGLYKYGKF